MEQVFIVIFIGKSINEPYNYSLYDNAFLLIQFAQLSLISRSWIFAVSFKLDSHSASEKPLKVKFVSIRIVRFRRISFQTLVSL